MISKLTIDLLLDDGENTHTPQIKSQLCPSVDVCFSLLLIGSFPFECTKSGRYKKQSFSNKYLKIQHNNKTLMVGKKS